MTNQMPCRQPENDPDDWFISKDGKQYADDPLITEDEVMAHLAQVDPDGTRSLEEIERVWDRLEGDAKRKALQRRRHAREKCHQCPVRTHCLGLALESEMTHGTWGGYYEEELREIRKEIARRKRKIAKPNPTD